MEINRLIYYSNPVHSGADTSSIADILNSARLNNEKNNITGILVFNGYYFLQAIEGSRSSVNNLLRSILNDRRHKDVTIVNSCEVHERIFEQWSMAYVPDTQRQRKILLKYSTTSSFEPENMSAKQIAEFLKECRNISV